MTYIGLSKMSARLTRSRRNTEGLFDVQNAVHKISFTTVKQQSLLSGQQ